MAGNKGLKSKELVKVPTKSLESIRPIRQCMIKNHKFSFNWNMGVEHGTNLKSIIVDQYGPSRLLIIGQIKFSEMFPEFVWQSVVFQTHSYRFFNCSA